MTPTAPQLRRSLLDWYDQCRRELPWRAQPGEVPDAYAVWLSEIMLQQTTVATVAGYWRAFLDRWPRVEDLARAAPDDVMHAWQGLGYYARARNLHACAKHVANVHDGRFPADEALLRGLPGIGDYTAAAIAAIAYGRPAVPVDGNVVRVLARMHALPTPLPAVRTHIMRLAETLVAADRSGDFAQALMDLGATVCTAPPTALSRLSLARRLRCAGGRRARGISQDRTARREAGALGRRLLGGAIGWRGAGAQAAAARPARRHGRVPVDPLA